MGNQATAKRLPQPADNLKKDLRRLINQYFHYKRKRKIFDLIGCTETFFMEWIDFQFAYFKKEDLSWKNYGLIWHILPLQIPGKPLDMKNPIVRLKFFNWTNLFAVEVYTEIPVDTFPRREVINQFLTHKKVFSPREVVVAIDNTSISLDHIHQMSLDTGERLNVPALLNATRSAKKYAVQPV